MSKYALGILALLLMFQASAGAGVTVSWRDALSGPTDPDHEVILELLDNPDYVTGGGGYGTLEPAYAWLGTVNVVMDDANTNILLTVSGNFLGGSGIYEQVWPMVRIWEYVQNETSHPWSAMDMWTAPLDPHTNVPAFQSAQEQWLPDLWYGDVALDPPFNWASYYAPEPTGPFLPVHDSFFDVTKVHSGVDENGLGDGGFTVLKIPTLVIVPEPGSIVALAGCMVGLLAHVRRRKA